MSAS
ncbi:hypothetical protein BpHYR1_035909 [Brachionus plicatilis]|jgi:hypothetical protein